MLLDASQAQLENGTAGSADGELTGDWSSWSQDGNAKKREDISKRLDELYVKLQMEAE